MTATTPALQRVAGLLHTRTDAGGVVREFGGLQRAWLGQLPAAASEGDYLTAFGVPARELTFIVKTSPAVQGVHAQGCAA